MEQQSQMNLLDLSSKQRLERYEKVNTCQTPLELCETILSFADKDGMIEGRSRQFNAERIANNALFYMTTPDDECEPNVVTREFGLRQQAMHIKYFTHGRGKELYQKQLEQFKAILEHFPDGV